MDPTWIVSRGVPLPVSHVGDRLRLRASTFDWLKQVEQFEDDVDDLVEFSGFFVVVRR